MASGGLAEVINNKGCSRLFVVPPDALPPSSSPLGTPTSSSLASPASVAPTEAVAGPFAGLVICVTGLSKEVRKEVMVATERLGGQYSPSLHPECTHLVVQSFGGRKFDHAVKHGLKNGLLVVTLGWFVDSVRRNARMREALYDARSLREMAPPSLPAMERGPVLSNKIIHVDPDVSSELKKKVVDAATAEGATCIDQWFVGCRANYVVCEGPHLERYIGHANSLVTPLWLLKSVREKQLQRLVHLSSDLARHVAVILEQDGGGENARRREILIPSGKIKTLGERRRVVEAAKISVKSRRSPHASTLIRPITPSNLLDSICWSVSDPTSSASVYADCAGAEDTGDGNFSGALSEKTDLDASFSNLSRRLKESEKSAVILKTHFLTILFPVDRHGELGPCSRTFFSDGGFTCLQILDLVYGFYQEKMTAEEVALAIHSDSEQADALRSRYASEDASDPRRATMKRIDFLGTRRSFEVLKRIGGENYCSVYELVIRA